MLRDCVVIAVEGTHASGKTTLTHALAAHYREQGIHVATVEEPARQSPFIEEIVVHGKGQFDLETEVDLFAAQLSAQLRAARQHPMIICDKTVANVVAYAWIVLETPPRSRAAVTLDAMNVFCRAWAGTYDAVFYCCDRYSQHQQGDPYRAKVLDLQSAADRVVRSTCASAGQNVIDIPPGMTTGERVRWIAARLAKLGITARPTSGQAQQGEFILMARFVADRAARLLEMYGIGRPGLPGAQPGPRVRDRVLRRVGRVDPRQFGVLGRLLVGRLAVPAGGSGEEPPDARLAARTAVMHHGDAPHLVRGQFDAGFLGRLTDGGVADRFSLIDVPGRGHRSPAA